MIIISVIDKPRRRVVCGNWPVVLLEEQAKMEVEVEVSKPEPMEVETKLVQVKPREIKVGPATSVPRDLKSKMELGKRLQGKEEPRTKRKYVHKPNYKGNICKATGKLIKIKRGDTTKVKSSLTRRKSEQNQPTCLIQTTLESEATATTKNSRHQQMT